MKEREGDSQKKRITMWEILTFSALLLTLLVVVWYAYEIQKLRIETIKQTELSLKALVGEEQ